MQTWIKRTPNTQKAMLTVVQNIMHMMRNTPTRMMGMIMISTPMASMHLTTRS